MADQYEQTRDLVDKITALLKEGKCADARKHIREMVTSRNDKFFFPKLTESVMDNIETSDPGKDYTPREIGKAIFETYILELDLAGRKEDAEFARRYRMAFDPLKEAS